jgi:hypothetical protein
MLTILTTGDWPRGSVHVRQVASTRQVIPKVESLIDSAWRDGHARLGGRLFDGPMCRIESWHATPESLELTLSQTSYRIFLGTNLNPSVADRFGRDVCANPVGVSCILHTRDEWLMYGRRNANVAYYPHRVHPFAGTLEEQDLGDAFDAPLRELREELDLGDKDIDPIRCIGIAEDAMIRHPELIFHVRTNQTRQQIEDNVRHDEHAGCVAVETHKDALDQAIASAGDFTPIAIATLLLFGKDRFGPAWFHRAAASTGVKATSAVEKKKPTH